MDDARPSRPDDPSGVGDQPEPVDPAEAAGPTGKQRSAALQRLSAIDRRALLRRSALFATGAGTGAVGFAELADVVDRHLPLRPGVAGATVASDQRFTGSGELLVTWRVVTERRLVALTFDDGPRPEWTTMVLDTLARYDVAATFFMVGQRVREHHAVIEGRLDRHEVGNHTWAHIDMARRNPTQAYDDIHRSHEAILEVTGRAPRLFRPPYGHLGGSTALAANELAYRVVLWSVQMVESAFPNDPVGHARHIVGRTEPGTILLAHDVGPSNRLIALRGLPDMITQLRARGFEFVTVSELLRETDAVNKT
jgi:peptidoglycan/xylan/chitin deacetylase (PgdA/CDA1 family)